jgi:branched-chain amino acid transport system permease protein
MLWQGVFTGFTEGWMYILVAMGLALCFSVMRILQFAHGEIYMIGAYIEYYLFSEAGMNFFVALIIAALSLAVVGLILERVMFRRLRSNMEPALLGAIGITIILQTFGSIAFTSYVKVIPVPVSLDGVITFFGTRLPVMRLTIAAIGIVLVVALILVIRLTKVGNAMEAIAQDSESASLQGINVNPISGITLGISSALAAVAGGLMATLLPMSPYMGSFAISKAICVIILAGVGSIPGIIIAGLILGLVDGVLPLYADPTIATIVGFALIIIILIVRPQGLLGKQ